MFKMSSLILALAAAAGANATEYNKWLGNLDVQGGGFLKHFETTDAVWCRKQCPKVDNCVAVSWTQAERKCALYQASSDAVLGPTPGTSVWVFPPKCNQHERHIRYDGAEALMPAFPIKDISWCSKKCKHTEGCNAITFNWSTRNCELLAIAPGDFTRVSSREQGRGITSFTLCSKFELLPQCGAKGAPLCYAGDACEKGLVTTSDSTCSCGGQWESCCEGACDSGMACNSDSGDFGQCSPCGGTLQNNYEVCCPGNVCNQDDGQRRVCVGGNHCAPCGGEWELPCAEAPACDRGLSPDAKGQQCQGKW